MNIKLSGIVARPEIRFTPEGEQVLQFSVGLYRGKTKDGEYHPRKWYRIEAWGELAENSAWLTKGITVTVSGWLKPPRTWKDKEGVEHTAEDEVNAQDISEGDEFRAIEKPGDGDYSF